jgi:hypothetical protein
MIVSRLRDLLRRVPPTNNLFRKTKIYATGLSSALRANGLSSVETRMEQRDQSRPGLSRVEGGAAAAEFFI